MIRIVEMLERMFEITDAFVDRVGWWLGGEDTSLTGVEPPKGTRFAFAPEHLGKVEKVRLARRRR